VAVAMRRCRVFGERSKRWVLLPVSEFVRSVARSTRHPKGLSTSVNVGDLMTHVRGNHEHGENGTLLSKLQMQSASRAKSYKSYSASVDIVTDSRAVASCVVCMFIEGWRLALRPMWQQMLSMRHI
jgi:hypothetical protein